MTGSEALGMLLGKEVYDQVKDKINANDCYDVMKEIILSELGLTPAPDGTNVMSESLKQEIRQEVKNAILDSFFSYLSNRKFFEEQFEAALKKSKVNQYIDEVMNNESEPETVKSHECKECSCEKEKKTKETEKTEEDKVVDEVTDFAESFYKMIYGEGFSPEKRSAIAEATKILNKKFKD